MGQGDFNQQPDRTLSDVHEMVSDHRDTGNGIYISVRKYPTGDVEAVGLKLTSEDSLRRGGGAKRKASDKASMDESVLDKSRRRAKSQVRRKCMVIAADRLLTLTFRANVQDLDEAWKCFGYFNKLMRWRFGERWQYVAVPEFQKRGAVHFHLAVNGYYHANTVRRLWHRAVGGYDGNVDFTSPKKIKKNSWNPKRVAGYLAKYMSKCDVVGFNGRRYSSGGKIQLPDPVKGWLALGLSTIQVLRQIIERMTRSQVQIIWEAEDYYGITYVST